MARSLASVALVALLSCGDGGAAPGGAGAHEGGAGQGGAGAASEGGAGASSSKGGASSEGGFGGEGGIGAGGFDPGEPDCHPRETSSAHGAYFRKVRSEPDASYLTLHATGSLPTVLIDRDRWFSTDEPSLAYQNGPLDRPSLYLGGRASGVEVDAGLTWDRVYDGTGAATWTDVLESGSDGNDPAHRFVVDGDVVTDATGDVRPEGTDGLVENFAFRPFWRANGVWANPPVGSDENVYFYPGEGFRMQLQTAGSGELALTINGEGGDAKHFSTTFDAPGWGVGAAQSWKRVHSIDQFTVIDGERIGLETADLDVLPTRTKLVDTRWVEVRLLGSGGAELGWLDCDAPAVVGSDAILETGYDAIFLLYDQTAEGAERSVILPPEPQ